jgi:hypothetical protein
VAALQAGILLLSPYLQNTKLEQVSCQRFWAGSGWFSVVWIFVILDNGNQEIGRRKIPRLGSKPIAILRFIMIAEEAS